MLNVTPLIFTSFPPDMVALGCGDNAIALIGGLHGCLKKRRLIMLCLNLSSGLTISH